MRRILLVLALLLPAAAALAQTPGQAAACDDPAASADATIAGCSAEIAAGHLKGADLAGALNNRADGYLAKGKWDLAIADENKAVALDGGNANALNNRCMAYSGKTLYGKAVADCSAAIKLNPNYGHYYRNRAGAYLKQGKRAEALADYRQALKLDPNDVFAQKGMMSLVVRQIGATHQGEMPDQMKRALGIQDDAAPPAAKATP